MTRCQQSLARGGTSLIWDAWLARPNTTTLYSNKMLETMKTAKIPSRATHNSGTLSACDSLGKISTLNHLESLFSNASQNPPSLDKWTILESSSQDAQSLQGFKVCTLLRGDFAGGFLDRICPGWPNCAQRCLLQLLFHNLKRHRKTHEVVGWQCILYILPSRLLTLPHHVNKKKGD